MEIINWKGDKLFTDAKGKPQSLPECAGLPASVTSEPFCDRLSKGPGSGESQVFLFFNSVIGHKKIPGKIIPEACCIKSLSAATRFNDCYFIKISPFKYIVHCPLILTLAPSYLHFKKPFLPESWMAERFFFSVLFAQ